MQRIASITLGIVTLSYLWRPSRWAEWQPSKPAPVSKKPVSRSVHAPQPPQAVESEPHMSEFEQE
jgi:hypothetical protein